MTTFQRKLPEASAVYAELDKAMAKWEPQRREVLELNGSRINAMFASGQTEAGLGRGTGAPEKGNRAGRREPSRSGFSARHARDRLMLAGRDADAIREFKAAIPILTSSVRENADDEDTTVIAARSQRLQGIVEAYFTMLAREVRLEMLVSKPSVWPIRFAAARSSRRWRHRARARTANDPALAALVRKEQDLGKQVNAQLGLLNNVLSLSSAERDESGVVAAALRSTHCGPNATRPAPEISQRFPSLRRSGRSQAAGVEQIKAALVDGEAMLSFYFGQDGSFVWAVPKTARSRSPRSRRPPAKSRARSQVARSAGTAGRDDFRHPAVRSEARQ